MPPRTVSRWPRGNNIFANIFPSPAYAVAGGDFGEQRWKDEFKSLAGLMATVEVAPSTNVTYFRSCQAFVDAVTFSCCA